LTTITSKQSSLDERRAKSTAWALTFADLVTAPHLFCFITRDFE